MLSRNVHTAGILLVACVCTLRIGGVADSPDCLAAPCITTVDDDATGFGTFQSHNQKVVSTRFGIFMTYVKTPFDGATARLVRSVDGGRTFDTVWETVASTHAPALEAAADGTLYLVHGDAVTLAAYFYRLSPGTSFAPELLATIYGAHAQKYSLLLDESRGRLYYAAYVGPETRFVTLDTTGTVVSNYQLTGGERHALPSYPRMTMSDGVLYMAWSTDFIDSALDDAVKNYYSIHAIRSRDGGMTWRSLSGVPLVPPFVGDQGGSTSEITHASERPCSTWLGAFAVLGQKAHFIYKNAGNNGDLPCRLRETMRYQRFDAATGVREIDVSEFAPAKVLFDSRDGFIALSPREGRLFFSGRTASGQLAIVSSSDDGQTWARQSLSERLRDNIYAVGGQRVVTGDGQVIGSFTDDDNPAAVRFFRSVVTR
jgi:hypothetical protein